MKNKYTLALSILIFVVCASSLNAQNSETDPVIHFYLDKSDSLLKEQYIFNSDVAFSVILISILQKTDYHGELEDIDTASFKVYYNNGLIDSFFILDSASMSENNLPESLDFILPRLLDDSYFYFFPNDTGAGKLAIGFELVDTISNVIYSGLINLDRDSFRPLLLMHFDQNPEDFNRFNARFMTLCSR